MDTDFKVTVLSYTKNPQALIYQALHQDYSSTPVCLTKLPSEKKCGEIAVEKLLSGGKGHWGCFEHPSISFNCINFPHSALQQARTHRIGVSFDCQSFRYTSRWREIGEKLENLLPKETQNHNWGSILPTEIPVEAIKDLESIAYLRPAQEYSSRDGKFIYTEEQRSKDLAIIAYTAINYALNRRVGMSPEQARGVIPFDYRQHFVVTFNLRSLLHFLDLRAKQDAQWEITQLAEMLAEEAKAWCPEIMSWYIKNRYKKAKLAP